MNLETNKGNNNFEVDLTNCESEPIQIPGYVQSHGVLLTLNEENFTITQISQNCEELFGKTADELIENNISNILSQNYFEYLKAEVLPQDISDNPIYLDSTEISGQRFEVSAHRHQGILFLEFEHYQIESENNSKLNLYNSLLKKLGVINKTNSLQAFCGMATEAVREFTGFDRVMVYRFGEDDSGQVIAEAKKDDLESFLGLYYPASDIPPQARKLYKKQTLRFKVDVNETPAKIIPPQNPNTNEPLDMSFAALRSMSPIHIEYLQNMGVMASMSISIVKDDRLWGLIACHHTSPKYVSHAQRMSIEFMAHTIALQIDSKLLIENASEVKRLQQAGNDLIEKISASDDIAKALIKNEPNLLSTVKCHGATLIWKEKIYLLGQTPTEAEVKKISAWLWQEKPDTKVFSTNCLSAEFKEAFEFKDIASGMLSIHLTEKTPEFIIWFREEFVHSVSWAGNPDKPVTIGKFGHRLTPRKSFEEWKKEVTGHSKPWQNFELEFAENLRQAIVKTVLRYIDELFDLNKQLETSNDELDSFAFVASHDLKEPLRGINNYSNFLIEDYEDILDQEAIERLQTLVRLSDRMESLLDSLLHHSRIGRMDLKKHEIDINEVVSDALEFLRLRIEEAAIEIKVSDQLPHIYADKHRVGEVFTNLISNAIKYTNNEQKEIEIGYLEKTHLDTDDASEIEQVFFVKDNGIGIEPRHYEDIFRIFKRLHGRNDYGGGIGAGLTIVKKIIERHDGKIWLESTPGEGTTFYFTFS